MHEHRLMTESILEKACLPARHKGASGLKRGGDWGETLDKLERRLGTGFIIGMAGDRGNGKTQIAVELVRVLAARSLRSLYVSATEFFMDIKSTYKPNAKESEREVIQRYRKPALLILDEVGRRGETDWENRLLFELLDKRYQDVRDTLLISNQTPEEFKAAVGESVQSRMKEAGGLIVCKWGSFR